MIFGGLGAGLKHYDFRWFSGGARGWGHMAGGGDLVLPLGPIPSSKQFPGAIQQAKYIMKHAGMRGYEKAGCKLRKYVKSRL